MKDERKIEILTALENNDNDKLNELNITTEEIDTLINDIDNKIKDIEIKEKNDNDELIKAIDRRIDKITKLENNMKDIEKELNYTFPNDYKDYILKLLPLHLKRVFKDGDIERVFRYLNSFDSSDRTYILKAQQFDSEYKKSLIPIGLFEFGDLLCYERDTNKVAIYDHEQDKYEIIADSFNEFKNKIS